MTVAKVSLLSLLVLPGCAAKPAPVERLTNPVSSTPGSPLRSPAVPRLLGSPLDPAESPLPSAAATGLRTIGYVKAAHHTKQHSYHQRHWDACPPASSNESLGREMAFKAGFGEHWCDLRQLWREESGWNHRAVNRRSGACGIPQRHPCPRGYTNRGPGPQIDDGLTYIRDRRGKANKKGCGGGYGNPSVAYAHKKRCGWY